MTQQFNLGDIVTKQYGKKPAEVTYAPSYSGGQFTCRYLESKQTFYARDYELKLYEEETEMTADTKTLYSFTVDGKTAYGTHIGTNSQNQYLIEEKGTGSIHVFDKKDLEEVVPYTFSASINGKETHYIGTPDSAEGTWVMCSDPSGSGKTRPVYVEPRIIVSPFKL